MRDADFEWSNTVNASADNVQRLESDIEAVVHELRRLIDTTRNLHTMRFSEAIDEDVVQNHARQFGVALTQETDAIRIYIAATQRAIDDAHRVVEYFTG